MKAKIVFIITFLLLMKTACVKYDGCTSPDSDQTIHGSGDIVTDTLTVPQFHSVWMNTAGNVSITQGSQQQVIFSVDENICEYISIQVVDGKLSIGLKNVQSVSNLNLTVNIVMTELQELGTTSAGSIIGKNRFYADAMTLVSSSAGDIRLELEANQLYSTICSAGSLYLSGKVTNHYANVSSVGSLRAFNLFTDTTKVTVSSIGCAEVYVAKTLEAIISSLGSVYYKGNPTIYQSITSMGKLVNAN